MGDNSVKNNRIKIPKSHAHLNIIGRKSTKFQVDPMKDVEVSETRSLGPTAILSCDLDGLNILLLYSWRLYMKFGFNWPSGFSGYVKKLSTYKSSRSKVKS